MACLNGHQQCALTGDCQRTATLHCVGCSKCFCYTHITDHRLKLNEDMNTIISEHDNLKNMFIQHTSNPGLHPLVKKIDDWEKESIEKIQQRARKLREELIQSLIKHVSEMSKNLEPYLIQLGQAREKEDFIEGDLTYWKDKLELIKMDYISPLKLSLSQVNKTSFISNMSIATKVINERFDRVVDNKIRIIEDGQVIVHETPQEYKEIRGKNEYSTGIHRIRLRIESPFNSRLSLGINSKGLPLKNDSHTTKSAYLWRSDNYIFSEGFSKGTPSGPRIEMNNHDTITLIFDCVNRRISMINERTQIKHELLVNLDICPFPWQLHVNMFYVKESIRLLPL